jgi:hypothetical protein
MDNVMHLHKKKKTKINNSFTTGHLHEKKTTTNHSTKTKHREAYCVITMETPN